jgi:hypothetical protein
MTKNIWERDSRLFSFGARSDVLKYIKLAAYRRVGSSHLNSGKPNEDFSDFARLRNSKSVILLCADGIGDETCDLARFGSHLLINYIVSHVLTKDFQGSLSLNAIAKHVEEAVTLFMTELCKDHDDALNDFKSWVRVEPIKNKYFLARLSTTLQCVVASGKGVRYITIGDGQVMITDGEGAIIEVRKEPGSGGNTTRAFPSNKPQMMSLPRCDFLTLGTDGVELLQPVNEEKEIDLSWGPNTFEAHKEVVRRAAASNLTTSVSKNLEKLLLESPISSEFDSDDGSIAQLAANTELQEESEECSLGIEFQGCQMSIFGYHGGFCGMKGHSHARSVAFELNCKAEDPSFVPLPSDRLFDSVSVSILVHHTSQPLSHVELMVVTLLGCAEFLALESWGKSKTSHASNIVNKTINKLKIMLKDAVKYKGYSIAIAMTYNGQKYCILTYGNISFNRLEGGKMFSNENPVQNVIHVKELKGSIMCSIGLDSSSVQGALNTFQTPAFEIAPSLSKYKNLFKEGSAFFMVRGVKEEERFGEVITPGTAHELKGQFFNIYKGRDTWRPFKLRIEHAETFARDYIMKFGLPDIRNYKPKNPLPLADQVQIFTLLREENFILPSRALRILDGTGEADHVEEQKVQKQPEMVVSEVIKNVQHDVVEVEIEVPQPPYVELDAEVAGPNPPKVSWPKDFEPTYKLKWLPADPDYIVIEGIGRVTREQVYYKSKLNRNLLLVTLQDGRIVDLRLLPGHWQNVMLIASCNNTPIKP